ncbi:MAG: hydroxyacylglutathione hydrolase [Lysobacteraceae bacterium]
MPTLRAIPAFEDNYIWVLADTHGRALIVDPGDAEPVLAAIAADGLQPVAILLTHHHPDHIGGAAQLLQHFDVPCYAPVDSRIDCASHRVGEGDGVAIPELGLDFTTIEVHGHTSSHIAYFGQGIVFCGDALFSLGCGRMFEGTPEQMLASLDRLAELPVETLVCCGHEYTLANAAFASAIEPGNLALQDRFREARAQRAAGKPSVPSSMASELACNPFLRVNEQAVRTAIEQHLGMSCPDRVQVFAALRHWKDGFRA